MTNIVMRETDIEKIKENIMQLLRETHANYPDAFTNALVKESLKNQIKMLNKVWFLKVKSIADEKGLGLKATFIRFLKPYEVVCYF